MTKSQENAIERIKRLAARDLMFGDKSKYEFKEFKTDENEYFVSVVLEVGKKGDEGTLAEVFCRDRAQLFVGKRGGITYPVTNKKGDVVRREFRSVLGAVIDQRA